MVRFRGSVAHLNAALSFNRLFDEKNTFYKYKSLSNFEFVLDIVLRDRLLTRR